MCQSCNIKPTAEEAAHLDRRRLLTAGAVVGLSGAAALASAPAALAAPESAGQLAGRGGRRVPVENISIQLYTLRNLLEKDPADTLHQLARIGFKRVENAGVPTGLTAKQFRTLLDRNGLRSTSGHIASVSAPFDAAAWQKTLDLAHTLGQKTIIQSVVGVTGFSSSGVSYLKTKAEWQALAAALNQAGKRAHRAGFKFGLHNHFWEFLPLTDTPLVGSDILIAELDPRYVHFEVDIFWATYAHHDPAQLVTFLQNRIPQFHVKDMKPLNGATPPNGLLVDYTFTDPGTGIIDFKRVFAAKTASPRATEYIIERDDAGDAALTTAKVGFEFLRKIRF